MIQQKEKHAMNLRVSPAKFSDSSHRCMAVKHVRGVLVAVLLSPTAQNGVCWDISAAVGSGQIFKIQIWISATRLSLHRSFSQSHCARESASMSQKQETNTWGHQKDATAACFTRSRIYWCISSPEKLWNCKNGCSDIRNEFSYWGNGLRTLS